MPKYTRSKDGVDRISIRIDLRFSKQDLEDLRPLAKDAGYKSVMKWIRVYGPVAFNDWIDGKFEFKEDQK